MANDTPQENPQSENVAKIFMAEGRVGTGDHSDSFPMDVCSPNTLTGQVLNFDLQGRTPVRPAGVDYDMEPLRLNPNSLVNSDDDKSPNALDSQGRKPGRS